MSNEWIGGVGGPGGQHVWGSEVGTLRVIGEVTIGAHHTESCLTMIRQDREKGTRGPLCGHHGRTNTESSLSQWGQNGGGSRGTSLNSVPLKSCLSQCRRGALGGPVSGS